MSLNGALIIDKHSGVTSHDVVQSVRRLFQLKEVGHAGTLDPLATGVLVCLLGDATKLSQYVMSEHKSYEVGILLGVKTDTGDITGEKIKEGSLTGVNESSIKEKMALLTGSLDLEVPKYSAVKVEGKKLYEYARNNEDVALPVKNMVIQSLETLLIDVPRIRLKMNCEKGTYVRSWVEKLGEDLGCGATVESLRRLKSGEFRIENSVSLEKLESMDEAQRQAQLVPIVDVLSDWPQLRVEGRDLVLLKNGQVPKTVYSQMLSQSFKGSGVRLTDDGGHLVAIALRDPKKGVKLARVFNVC